MAAPDHVAINRRYWDTELAASNDFPEITPEWSRRWPSEEVWIARRR